jgi:hypothetical protein
MLKVSGTVPLDILARHSPPPNLGAQAQPIPKVLQLYPWWLYKPPQGQDINFLAQNNFIAAGTVQLTDLTLSLDQSTIAIIRGIDIYVNDMTPTVDVDFVFSINGNPIPGYGNVTPFPRTAASVVQSFDTFIYVQAGSKITVSVTNNDGGTYAIGYGYQGWTVPSNIDAILGISGGAYTGVG